MSDTTDGAALFDDVRAFLARFVAYPSDAALVAHTLWVVHTHLMDKFESTPRIAFLSPEPGSGKSRALEVTEPLVPRPVHSINSTPAYLFRKVSDPAGLPTILYDEIDTVFGPKAKDNEDVRGLLNAGHRQGATAGRCVVHGKTVDTEELPAYCAVALAGLNDLPDTIMTRAVVIRMRRRAPTERVEQWRHRTGARAAAPLRARLERWATTIRHQWGAECPIPDMPDGIEDRNADVWEALLAVADAAGGHWPGTARCNAVTLVTESLAASPSLGVLLLGDLRRVFNVSFGEGAYGNLETKIIIEGLHALPESPWAALNGTGIDGRWLSRRLGQYGVKSKTVRVEGNPTPVRGYAATDLADPWGRYLTTPTPPNPEPVGEAAKGRVTSVTALQDSDPPCRVCGKPLWAPQSRAVGMCGHCVKVTSNGHAHPDLLTLATGSDL